MISISGIVTAVLLVSFIGIAVWAYGKDRREQFDRAARAPLEGDEP
jgi:cytochrome c oxidase cbb3-type subunit IV